MFSARIVTTDHYLATPVTDLDVMWSNFRGSEVTQVPVIRIFGPSLAGQKACIHVHGVFPYLYVPYDGSQPAELYLRQFAASVDKAVNIAFGKPTSNKQHVYKISIVTGVPFYGYHPSEQQFLKIYLYNPLLVKKVADLLLGGAVMNKLFQPHESHIPYALQFFIDYNLYGMNVINFATVKFRSDTLQGDHHDASFGSDLFDISDENTTNKSSHQKWTPSNIPSDLILNETRHSVCELEVDGVAADILNKLDVHANLGTNPGLVALWEEERNRCREMGDSSQLIPPDSQERTYIGTTDSEVYLKQRLCQILSVYKESVAKGETDKEPSLSALQSSNVAESLNTKGPVQSSDDEAFVDEASVYRVMASSQSFHGSQYLLEDTQNQSLIEVMNELAVDMATDSSQISQLSNPDNDSILHSLPVDDGDDDGNDEDDGENLEMSQQVWDFLQESQLTTGGADTESTHTPVINSSAAVSFDLSWNSSQLRDIPQMDGANDDLDVNDECQPSKLPKKDTSDTVIDGRCCKPDLDQQVVGSKRQKILFGVDKRSQQNLSVVYGIGVTSSGEIASSSGRLQGRILATTSSICKRRDETSHSMKRPKKLIVAGESVADYCDRELLSGEGEILGQNSGQLGKAKGMMALQLSEAGCADSVQTRAKPSGSSQRLRLRKYRHCRRVSDLDLPFSSGSSSQPVLPPRLREESKTMCGDAFTQLNNVDLLKIGREQVILNRLSDKYLCGQINSECDHPYHVQANPSSPTGRKAKKRKAVKCHSRNSFLQNRFDFGKGKCFGDGLVVSNLPEISEKCLSPPSSDIHSNSVAYRRKYRGSRYMGVRLHRVEVPSRLNSSRTSAFIACDDLTQMDDSPVHKVTLLGDSKSSVDNCLQNGYFPSPTCLKKKPLEFSSDGKAFESPRARQRLDQQYLLPVAHSGGENTSTPAKDESDNSDFYDIESCPSPDGGFMTDVRQLSATATENEELSGDDVCKERYPYCDKRDHVIGEKQSLYIKESHLQPNRDISHSGPCSEEQALDYHDSLFNLSYLSPLSRDDGVSPPTIYSPTGHLSLTSQEDVLPTVLSPTELDKTISLPSPGEQTISTSAHISQQCVCSESGMNTSLNVSESCSNEHVVDQQVIETSLASSSGCHTYTPRICPPSYQDVETSMHDYGLSEVVHSPAFCSVSTDLPAQAVVVGENLLHVSSNLISDLQDYDGQKDHLKKWQIVMSRNNTSSPDSSFSFIEEMRKNLNMRSALLSPVSLIYTPSQLPPSGKSVQQWLHSQMVVGEKAKGNDVNCKTEQPGMTDLSHTCVEVESSPDMNESSDVVQPTPEKMLSSGRHLTLVQHSTPMHHLGRASFGLRCTPIQSPEVNQSSQMQQQVDTPPSSKKTVDAIRQKNYFATPVQSIDGCQIEGPTLNNTYGFKVSRRNVRDTKSVNEKQYLTVLSVEVFCTTRGDLKPDPEFDAISAIFYCIHDDREADDYSGVFVVDSEPGGGRPLLQRCGVTGLHVSYATTEMEMLEQFIQFIHSLDPDILVGYEVQMSSWGYLFERSASLDMNLCAKVSRLPDDKLTSHFGKEHDEWGADHSSDLRVAGRVVINLWRFVRHEVTLNIYTFENVYFHVLHQRVPLFSHRTMTRWYSSDLSRWKVIENCVSRVRGNIDIIKKLDLIGQASEFARIYGIEFYHVLSRGSQYRVESMMLRLAKPQNFIAVSPSVQQRSFMKAPECISLVMEPESRFYTDPVVVVDFQSLYPSIMIAYNYCFSTCLGRLESWSQLADGPIKFGCTHLDIDNNTLTKLSLDDLNISPNGVVFVKPHIRKGIISSMVKEILDTRIMVKTAMKLCKDDKYRQQMLHSRQLGLKLIANVTYGYTSANFSGRMPCVEVADSIVRKARETLERAIKQVEETKRWNARVVYGDTDSMFILLKGRSKEQAFKIGYEIVEAVTAVNPKPVKLKFEKVYLPCVLQTKKRYVGFMYETPEQTEPVFDAKGIETVRRDSCAAVPKILERSIKVLFTTKDVSQVKQYVMKQCLKISDGRVSMQDLTFAREYRGAAGYKPGACVPALEISRKLLRSDRRSEPRVGERVPYVIVYGTPGLPLIQLVRRPDEVLSDQSLRLNVTYYITKQVLPPLSRIFSLLGVNVFLWYNELPKFNKVTPMSSVCCSSKQGTISQYFASRDCLLCGELSIDGVCAQCRSKPQQTAVVMNELIRKWERSHNALNKICASCCRHGDTVCISLDCPVMYQVNKSGRNLAQVSTLLKHLF